METNKNFYANLDFQEELGQGGYGTVNRVIFKKPYKGYTEAGAKSVRRLRRQEVYILRKLDHPNIIKFITWYSDGPVNIILFEYVDNGSLHDYLMNHARTLPKTLQQKWAKEAGFAIQYLHKCKCLHRDIKPSNCLLCEDNILKLCDFGFAQEFNHDFILSSEKGTYQYMAPEIINTNDSGQATFSIYTDIYAYGMLLLAIYTRQTPFHGMLRSYVVYHVGSGKLQPEIPDFVPEELKDEMRKCWDLNPKRRPTIESILETLEIEAATDTPSELKMQRKILPKNAMHIAHHPNGVDMVEVSLESRRQAYASHLRHGIWVDIIRSNDPVEQLLALYATNPDAYKEKIDVRYFDETKDPGYAGYQPMEEGIDQNGITKDFFANLFRAPINRFAASVPLSIGFAKGTCSNRCECMLLAMLCMHGYLLTGQVPKYLPKLLVMGMFCSADITDDFLGSMVDIFTEDQVSCVKQAICRYREDDVQDEDMRHLCALAEWYDRPPPPKDPKEFEEWFKALVLASCVKKPCHFVSIFKQYRESIPTLECAMPSDAQQILHSLRPTRTDILRLLSPKFTQILDIDPTLEYYAFQSLLSFLTTCEESLAVKFLLFCTGSESLTVREIEVEFYQDKGYPVASTCFSSVRIPTGYEQYDEFQERMIEALAHPENYHFHRA